MEVPLSQGKVAHIDPEDWPLIVPHRWYAAKKREGRWYAQAAPIGDENGKKVRMHNVITGIKNVDHWNENGLDNRRQNLRPCTTAKPAEHRGKGRRVPLQGSVVG